MPKTWGGTLNTNAFYNATFNAYRLITTLADNLSAMDDSLVEKFRVDGGMYDDKKVYTDCDVLMSRVWDPEDANVLEPEMTADIKQQEIVIDKQRQIGLQTENYLSKKAWQEPTSFDEFNSVVQAQVSNTKKVYEQRLVDVYVGTVEATAGKQEQTINITDAVGTATGEEASRIEAQAIARALADCLVELKDTTRDFNDNGFLKAFNEDDIMIVYNSEFYNKILYTDLPTIYHKDNLLKNAHVLPARYFGTKVNSAAAADGATHLAADEYKIRVKANGEYDAAGTIIKNVFAGDVLPKGTPMVAQSVVETTGKGAFTINGKSRNVTYYSTVHAYTKNADIICKFIHKNGIKFFSSFVTSTEFWNDKNLRTNRYLTWNYANPEYLAGYPVITFKKV